MEVGAIDPIHTADKTLAAWLVVREVLEGATPPAIDEAPPPEGVVPVDLAGLHGEVELTAPVSEPQPPGADSDFSHEASTVQSMWRAPTPAADVPHRSDEAVPAMPAAQSELSVPAALLVPTMLTGLRVEPALGWAQLPPGATQWPVSGPQRERRQRRERDGQQEQAPDEPPEAPPPAAARNDDAAPDAVLDRAEAGAWCDALSRALRAALGARVVPQPLLAAADQWKRGRCVVLACPLGDDPAGPAWAFVLWPVANGQHTANGVAPELTLRGLRVDARLQWSAPPRHEQWCHVRVVKEHHPRSGRQLVSLDENGAASEAGRPVPCEVQLGPVLARSLRWCEVRVRIQAAQRFWNALGTQWSVHVVVSAQPLIAPPATLHGGSPC
ncbi:MAG TPA: hypothetical protein VLJ62_30580 [Burkholderiaceae bacterium]|nr:hypothetical protein [Burkholderiaceae bacterium]